MTGLAQEGGAVGEQRRVHGPVRCVAEAAILAHGSVLPEIRSALVSMTGITGIVHRARNQQIRIQGVMGRMAGTAIHVAFLDGMRGIFCEICPDALMAAVTHVGLLCLHQNCIVLGMDGMAANACETLAVMYAALPADPMAVLVAGKADLVLFRDRGRGVLAEQWDCRTRVTGMQVLGMLAAGAMASLALQLGKWTA